jgi:hypothetical protein
MTVQRAIIEHGLMDVPDEEVASMLSPLTRSPMECSTLAWWLREQGLADSTFVGLQVQLTGALPDLVINPQTPVLIAEGVRSLLQHVYHRGSRYVLTDRIETAGQVAAVVSGLLQMGVVTEQQVGAFYLLADGLLWPQGVTADQVSAAKAAILADAALERVRDINARAFEDAAAAKRTGASPDEIIATAKAVWESE